MLGNPWHNPAVLGILMTIAMVPLASSAGPPHPVQLPAAPMGTLDNREPIPYFIADGAGIPGYEASDRGLARAALDAWARESNGRLRFVEAESEDAAAVHVVWISPGGGLYGEMRRVLVEGEIRTFVYITPSIEGQGPVMRRLTMEDPLLRDTIVYLTCVHELGHAVGLGHTSEFEDIMYSFGFGGDIVNYFMRYRLKLQDRSDIERNSGLSANDRDTLLRLYENPRGE